MGIIGKEASSSTSADSERTALLTADRAPANHGTTEDGSPIEEEDDIDPNEFDLILSRTSSNSGMGSEVESQENSMLRGPRRYSAVRGGSRHSSRSRLSSRRRSVLSVTGIEQAIEEDDEEEEDSKSPYMGVSVARFWVIYGGVLANYFIACFDTTIMASSHPVITSYFHSANSASWLSTAFLLTSTSFQPLFGRLSDTIGRKKPYMFTLAVFFGATVWCALAQSMTSFIAARALCGLGAGGLMCMGSIITSDLVPIEIRGAYQSYINIIFGVGSMLGAALGGAIADHLGWRWEFGIQLPSIGICLILGIMTIPERLGLKEDAKQKTVWEAMKVFDYKGSLLLTTSITSLILGLNLGGNVLSWTHPVVIAAIALFATTFPLFLWNEGRVPFPIMPLKLLSRDPQASIIIGNAIAAVIQNAVIFNIPIFFQAVLLESATSSGLRLIIPSLSSAVVGTYTGFAITHTRRLKWPLMSGSLLLFGGTIGLTCLRRGFSSWVYLLFLVPTSMGSGFTFPGSFMAVLAVSKQEEQAVVTSTLILWRSIGMVMGVSSSSLVLQNALVRFLDQRVVGPDKDEVIRKVRTSISYISKLPPVYREQVIEAYELSLRATFLLAVCLAVVIILLTVRLQLPRLGEKKKRSKIAIAAHSE